MKSNATPALLAALLLSVLILNPASAATYEMRVPAAGLKPTPSATAIAPVIDAWSVSTVEYGAAPRSLTPPASTSPGSFLFASDNPAVATISGSVLSIVGVGVANITATQAEAPGFAAASVSASLSVLQADPVLGAFSNMSQTYGDSPFNLAAPNGTGVFSYTSSNTAVASISNGNRVTMHTAGSVQITATQAATANYRSGAITAQLDIAKVTPTFSAYTLPFKTMGAASYAITPPSSSPGAGTYSYASSNPAVATIAGDVVTLTGPGAATITATRVASTNYNEVSTTATLNVSPAPAPTDTAWNALDKGADMNVNSALVVTGGGATSQWEVTRANTGKSTGRYVFELKTNTNSTNISCGLANGSAALVGQLGTSGTAIGMSGGSVYRSTMATTPGITAGNCATTVMIAVDLDAGLGWVANGGAWVHGGSPATGANPAFTFPPNTLLYPAASIVTGYSYTVTANFGTKAFVNPVPAGFTAGWF